MTPHKREEVDAWWGSYSIKSVLPGLLAGLAASALVMGTAWLFPHAWHLQLLVLGTLGLCWLALLLLWIYLIFGVNYRLTTLRLFVETGLHRRRVRTLELSSLKSVTVQANRLEKLLGVGRLLVEMADDSLSPLILRGVHDPDEVAAKILNLKDQLG